MSTPSKSLAAPLAQGPSHLLEVGGGATKKVKGVRKADTKNQFQRIHYKRIATGETDHKPCRMYVFRSHLHEMFTEKIHKVALTARDDKRYQIPGTPHTWAWGHHNIKE